MSDTNVPNGLHYTREHEWAKLEDGIVTVGITHYAQDALGDITYLELPAVGDEVSKGDGFGVVESVKTFSDLYAPVSGVVTAINDGAVEEPVSINEAPYGDGWLLKIEVSDATELDTLMSAEAYRAFLEESG
jgi:glycine cleavage system H protein